jgi:hypothetical protein
MKPFLALILTTLALLTGPIHSAAAQTTLTVTHGPVPQPTLIDLGAPGDSVGDQRIWEFDAQSADQQKVVTDWIMTTTSQGSLVPGMEKRLTVGVFAFGADGKDTILMQGIGLYPMTGSTLKSSAVLQRAVIGGTGKYAGAVGTVTSTHFDDNTWQHVFNLQ